MGLATVGSFRKSTGDHEYVKGCDGVMLAVACNWLVPPLQIVAGDAVTFVNITLGLTVIVTEALPVHPASVIIFTVYVVVAFGLAVTTEPDIFVNPVKGTQVNV